MTGDVRRRAQDLSRHVSRAATPAFVCLAIMIGGASREGVLAAGLLQLIGLAIIAWCLLDVRTPSASAPTRPALWLAAGFLGVAALQLVPLPWSLWTVLPHRDEVASAFTLTGQEGVWAPLSLAPAETRAGLLWFIPPFAAYLLAISRSWRSLTAYLLWALPTVASISVVLGLAQLFDGPESALYFFDITSREQPVGFFANINHQATLLLMACPFMAALASHIRRSWGMGDTDYGKALIAAALGMFLILGVLIAGSFAGYLLLGPTLLCCFLVYGGGSSRHGDMLAIGLGGVAITALIVLTATSPLLGALGVTDWSSSDLARGQIFANSFKAVLDHLPFGSGLGSFEALYPAYENPATVTYKFVNHAHNDYLEFVLEMGLFGVAGIAALLAWLGRETYRVWTNKDGSDMRLKRAASVSLAVVIFHSLVDYPLRTPAIAVAAAVCLAVLVAPTHSTRAPSRNTSTDITTAKRQVTL